jgi:hypothetical protein
MVEVLWALFLIGAGFLWVGLVYVSLSSSGLWDADQHWPVWEVLLRGGREREGVGSSRPHELPLNDENCECGPASEGS